MRPITRLATAANRHRRAPPSRRPGRCLRRAGQRAARSSSSAPRRWRPGTTASSTTSRASSSPARASRSEVDHPAARRTPRRGAGRRLDPAAPPAEVSPPRLEAASADAASEASGPGVEILLETEIDALDIPVLAGGGDAVGQWALDNGFLLTPDAPEVLDFYAQRSPCSSPPSSTPRGRRSETDGGPGGTPVHITMETPRWVPLRIPGLGVGGPDRAGRRVPPHRRRARAARRWRRPRRRAQRARRGEPAGRPRSDVGMGGCRSSCG